MGRGAHLKVVGKRGAAAAGLYAIVLALQPAAASAETFPAACAGTTGDVASLVSAINSANANGAAPDVVALGPGCVYTLTAVDNYWYGPNGLPAIASDITIQGNGATIARPHGSPRFRLFFVGADPVPSGYVSPGAGRLTLRELTLTGGLANGGASNGGGGGAGLGGAIFSQGAVVIERSTLTGNQAYGGAAGVPTAGGGGGGIGTDAVGGAGGGFGPGAFPGDLGGPGGPGDDSGDTGSGGAGGGGAGFHNVDFGYASNGPDPGAGGGEQTGLGGYGAGSPGAPGALGGDGSGGGGGRGECGCGGFPDGVGGSGGSGGNFGAGGGRGGDGTEPLDSDANGGGGGGGGGGVGGGGGAGGTGGPEGDGFEGEGGHGGAGGFGGGGGEGGLAGNPATPQNPGGSGGFGGGGGRPRPVIGNGDGGFGGGTATTTTAAGGAGMGGAIFNMQGDLTIRASTLAGNSAAGGLPAVPDPGKGLGGAIFNLSGSLEAVGVTFADNTATHDGSSIYNLVYDAKTTRTAGATLRDSIVADASAQVDLVSDKPSMTLDLQPNLGSANALVGDFDLVRTYVASDAGTVTGTPLTADPLLGPLGDNGGPTRTMAPAEGSPVVDAGSAFGLTTDQRGLSRPFDLSAIPNAGDGSDIGAVELPLVRPGQPGGGGGPGSTPAFGANTLVTLTLAAKRIPASGPLKVRVVNANGFEIEGSLAGQTVNRISAARKRRIKLRAKQFKVAANARATARLVLPKPVRRVLKRTGRVRLRLTASVKDPAGNTRTVKKRVTPRLKRKR